MFKVERDKGNYDYHLKNQLNYFSISFSKITDLYFLCKNSVTKAYVTSTKLLYPLEF